MTVEPALIEHRALRFSRSPSSSRLSANGSFGAVAVAQPHYLFFFPVLERGVGADFGSWVPVWKWVVVYSAAHPAASHDTLVSGSGSSYDILLITLQP